MNNNTTIFSRVLTGINSTLNIANKIMPIYREAKPLVQTVTKTYKNLKTNKNELSNMLKLIKIKNELNKTNNVNLNKLDNKQKLISNQSNSNINNPKFFI